MSSRWRRGRASGAPGLGRRNSLAAWGRSGRHWRGKRILPLTPSNCLARQSVPPAATPLGPVVKPRRRLHRRRLVSSSPLPAIPAPAAPAAGGKPGGEVIVTVNPLHLSATHCVGRPWAAALGPRMDPLLVSGAAECRSGTPRPGPDGCVSASATRSEGKDSPQRHRDTKTQRKALVRFAGCRPGGTTVRSASNGRCSVSLCLLRKFPPGSVAVLVGAATPRVQTYAAAFSAIAVRPPAGRWLTLWSKSLLAMPRARRPSGLVVSGEEGGLAQSSTNPTQLSCRHAACHCAVILILADPGNVSPSWPGLTRRSAPPPVVRRWPGQARP